MSVNTYPEAVLTAKWRLVDAIRACAKRAAEFQVSAENIDRPLSETPWLERYGTGTYDARWYSVMGAMTGFIEGVAGSVEDEIAALVAVAYIEGHEGQRGASVTPESDRYSRTLRWATPSQQARNRRLPRATRAPC